MPFLMRIMQQRLEIRLKIVKHRILIISQIINVSEISMLTLHVCSLTLSGFFPFRRFEMDREPHEARFCAECNKRHGAEEGDLWAESSMLGLKITYFAFMDGKVYDITGICLMPPPE